MKKNKKLAIVVCCSESWIQIPVGTFGLSSLLDRNNIEHLILHSHLQSKKGLFKIVDDWIEKGFYFALVLHWKENTRTFYDISRYLRSKIDDPFRISCGGITASFFYDEILDNPELPDIVFRGDCEIPVLDFCQNKPFDEIDNVAFKIEGKKVVKPITYLIDEELFSQIRFTYFDRVYNKKKFISRINNLYFHVNLSRGCDSLCLACGGSKFASVKHSNRRDFIYRKTASALDDIKNLYRQTKHLNKPLKINLDDYYDKYIPVLEKIGEEGLASKIDLFVSERGFLDKDRVKKDLKIFKTFHKVTFEISPDTENDEQRRALANGNKKYLYTVSKTKALVKFLSEHNLTSFVYYNLCNFFDDKESIFERLHFFENIRNYYKRHKAELLVTSLSLDPASIDYTALDNPPALYDYFERSSKFSNLLGNLLYVKKDEFWDYLILCRFFLNALNNKALYKYLKDHAITLDEILRAVQKRNLRARNDDKNYFKRPEFHKLILSTINEDRIFGWLGL